MCIISACAVSLLSLNTNCTTDNLPWAKLPAKAMIVSKLLKHTQQWMHFVRHYPFQPKMLSLTVNGWSENTLLNQYAFCVRFLSVRTSLVVSSNNFHLNTMEFIVRPSPLCGNVHTHSRNAWSFRRMLTRLNSKLNSTPENFNWIVSNESFYTRFRCWREQLFISRKNMLRF